MASLPTTETIQRNIRTTLDETARAGVRSALQPTLVELIDLALTGKQLHWNVFGPRFKPVHEHLDELIDEYRTWSDEVAERMTALGMPADGRSQRIAGDTPLDPAPESWRTDSDTLTDIAARIEVVAHNVRRRIAEVAEHDPGSEDLLIEVLQGLEKQLWMVNAQEG